MTFEYFSKLKISKQCKLKTCNFHTTSIILKFKKLQMTQNIHQYEIESDKT